MLLSGLRHKYGIPFPLTLTLSLGEREHLVGVVTFASGRPANPAQVLANKRRRMLSLPWGEGRGEGKRDGANTVRAEPFRS